MEINSLIILAIVALLALYAAYQARRARADGRRQEERLIRALHTADPNLDREMPSRERAYKRADARRGGS